MPEQRKFAVATAFVALCLIWSSTWLVIKVGLRDLPPISFVAIRFVIAVAVLLAISVGRVRLLPARRADFKLLAYTGVLMFSVNYALLFWAESSPISFCRANRCGGSGWQERRSRSAASR